MYSLLPTKTLVSGGDTETDHFSVLAESSRVRSWLLTGEALFLVRFLFLGFRVSSCCDVSSRYGRGRYSGF